MVKRFGRIYKDTDRIQRDIEKGRNVVRIQSCDYASTMPREWPRSRPKRIHSDCPTELPDESEMKDFLHRQEQRTWCECEADGLHHRHVGLLAKAFKLLARNTQLKIIRLGELHYQIDHPDFWDLWPEDGPIFEIFHGCESVERPSSEKGYGYVEKLIMKAIEKNNKKMIRATCKKFV